MDYVYTSLIIFWGWLGLDCAVRNKLGTSVICALISGVFYYILLSM